MPVRIGTRTTGKVVGTVVYGRERDDLLAWLLNCFKADSSIAAVWLGGSFGRGRSADPSDLDLWIVVDDGRRPS